MVSFYQIQTLLIATRVISAVIFMAYCTWAIALFFNGKKIIDYVKSFFAYLLGTITFTITAMLLGVLIDLAFKH